MHSCPFVYPFVSCKIGYYGICLVCVICGGIGVTRVGIQGERRKN